MSRRAVRLLSTLKNTALIYERHGNPSNVVRAHTYSLEKPTADHVSLKFLLSPVNPADINVIQGQPNKPDLRSAEALGSQEPAYIGGNEGLAEVIHCGANVSDLKIGDWVIMGKAQFGTWQSYAHAKPEDLIPLPRDLRHLSPVAAATLMVNPCTAYRMLHDFVPLAKGDWIIQNAANSAVGQAVIQICRDRGINTINIVRQRPNMEELVRYLTDLGATKVVSIEELGALRQRTDAPIRLGLNCVGGRSTTIMAKHLSHGAHLVTYGGMAKEAVQLPPSLHIFKDLKSVGFWLAHWSQTHPEARKSMTHDLARMLDDGRLQEPVYEIIDLAGPTEATTERARKALEDSTSGLGGTKRIFSFEAC